MNTLNVQLFDLTTLLFGGASGTYLAAMYGKKETLARIGTWICVAAAIVSTAALGVRWVESYKMGIGRIPVTNLYESLVFFAWSVNLFYLFVEWKYKNRAFGAFVIPIAFLTMVFAFTNESGIQPLVPALQSYWLHAHVITCFVGYAAFAVSAGVAVMYLLKARQEEARTTVRVIARFPSSKVLDDLVYRAIIWGSVPHRGDHHGRGLGELRVGNVLVVGPEGDVVAHRLARLRGVPARPDYSWVARDAGGRSVDCGVPRNHHVLPGRQPGPVRPPQLWKLKKSTRNGRCHETPIPVIFASNSHSGVE
jgi:ABC-type uncharacterized transport system permease subunit